MSTPYTYRITHLPSGKHYYGCRYAKNCHPSDLWVTYFTSSSQIKRLIEQDGKKSFVIEIRKVFQSESECRAWENKVLRRLKIPNNENWINKYTVEAIGFKGLSDAMMSKYGVSSPSRLDSVKDKKKASSLSKFGTEYPWQSEEIRDKKNSVMLERYGYINPSQVPEFKQKISEGISRAHLSNPDIVCPKCGYICKSMSNMLRYHFDNCKHFGIIALHNEGYSPTEIQERVGLDRHSVAKYLKFFGLESNDPKIKKIPFGAKNMIVVKYKGVEYRSIQNLCESLGVKRRTVENMIKSGEVVVTKPCESKQT